MNKNLEEKLEKSFLNKLRTRFSSKTSKLIIATSFVLGAAYISGCGSGEESACCAALSCTSSNSSTECYCEYESPHQAQKCVTNDEGEQECCSCSCYSTKY